MDGAVWLIIAGWDSGIWRVVLCVITWRHETTENNSYMTIHVTTLGRKFWRYACSGGFSTLREHSIGQTLEMFRKASWKEDGVRDALSGPTRPHWRVREDTAGRWVRKGVMIKGASLHHLAPHRSRSSLSHSTPPPTPPGLCLATLDDLPDGPSVAWLARRGEMACGEWSAASPRASLVRYTRRQGGCEGVRDSRATPTGGSYRQLSEFGLRKSAARGGMSMS